MGIAFRGVKNEIECRAFAKLPKHYREDGTLKTENVAFWLTVKRVPYETLKKFGEVATSDEHTTEEELEFYLDNIVGWRDVLDEDGVAVEFNEDNLVEFLTIISYKVAVAEAFVNANVGESSKRKN